MSWAANGTLAKVSSKTHAVPGTTCARILRHARGFSQAATNCKRQELPKTTTAAAAKNSDASSTVPMPLKRVDTVGARIKMLEPSATTPTWSRRASKTVKAQRKADARSAHGTDLGTMAGVSPLSNYRGAGDTPPRWPRGKPPRGPGGKPPCCPAGDMPPGSSPELPEHSSSQAEDFAAAELATPMRSAPLPPWAGDRFSDRGLSGARGRGSANAAKTNSTLPPHAPAPQLLPTHS